ncbi:hypothetical protein [Oricola sp.]|uniref:hypothetical protein n=1 Tax=Oricola sp. TaxID=1979950 RepID=UPI0025DDEDF3|nr:hypothetical protein [Oricola sp.]MCI5075928.1 hypothetical protein [Oricola sp.]
MLAAGVIALFVMFFWHVAKSYVGSARRIVDYLDNSSQRRRAALEHEAKFGKAPLWLRALRGALVASAVGLMAVAFWNKFRLQ